MAMGSLALCSNTKDFMARIAKEKSTSSTSSTARSAIVPLPFTFISLLV